ncbi:MAG TPA: hypothetical protein VFO02_03000, partial [Burkholderiales bacterium]|nr:hypothetical protein [Burkholderiales bacterium]
WTLGACRDGRGKCCCNGAEKYASLQSITRSDPCVILSEWMLYIHAGAPPSEGGALKTRDFSAAFTCLQARKDLNLIVGGRRNRRAPDRGLHAFGALTACSARR